MTMFGGAYYLHVFAGHLSLLDACAWVPLLLVSLEEIAKRPGAKWALVGAAGAGNGNSGGASAKRV